MELFGPDSKRKSAARRYHRWKIQRSRTESFLEGETVLVLGGFAAHRGYLRLYGVVLAAFFGSLAGDQLFFFLGRRHSRWLTGKTPGWKAKMAKVDRMMLRYRIPMIVFFRFLYGLRTVAPFAIGAGSVPFRTFLLFNAIGAMIWAIAVGCGGYLFGHALEALIGDIKHYEGLILAAIAAVGLFSWALYISRRHQKERALVFSSKEETDRTDP